MFIHFLCLRPLRLAIVLNFNISKVAYSTTCSQLAYRRGHNFESRTSLIFFQAFSSQLQKLRI